MCVCVCVCKMFDIDKEKCKNSNIEAIVDGIGTLLLNEKHTEKELGYKNLPVVKNSIKINKKRI